MSGVIGRGFFMNDQGKLDYMQIGSKEGATGSLTESEAAIMAQIEIANALREIAGSIDELSAMVQQHGMVTSG